MINPFSAANNYVRNQSIDSTLFKATLPIPIVGTVMQIWKSVLIRQEFNKVFKLENIAKDDPQHAEICNKAMNKAIEYQNFHVKAFNYGRWADIAMLVSGAVLSIFNGPVCLIGIGLMTIGVISLFSKKMVALSSDGLIQKVQAQHPEKAFTKGYNVALYNFN